jgi:hypothetical protein
MWVDVNGDGTGSAIDALQVINELARRRAAESELSNDHDNVVNNRTTAVDRIFADVSDQPDAYDRIFDISEDEDDDDEQYFNINDLGLEAQPQLF